MAQSSWTTLTVPDQAVLHAFAKIRSELAPETEGTFSVVPAQSSSPTIKGRLSEMETTNPFLGYEDSSAAYVASFSFTLPAASGLNIGVTRNQPDSGFDQITVSFDESSGPRVLQILGAIRKALRPYERTAAIDRALGPALADFHRVREESIQRIEAANLRLFEDGVRYRQQLDSDLATRKAALVADFDKRATQLEADMALRESRLGEREAKLAEDKQLIDDRRATHARRKLREDLLAKLSSRATQFALSRQTRAKRWPIHILFIALSSASAWSLILALRSDTLETNWITAAHFLFSALAFATSIVFYIRWNDDWARRHAAEEFKGRRLELDVDRASWVVEMLLEWKDEKEGTSPPSELIHALVSGLFGPDDGSRDDRTRHPAEDLATALLSASSNVELNLGGNKLSIDRKGVQKLSG